MKFLIPIAFILIIASLFSALFFVMKDKGRSNRAVYALTFRVGFSVLLFLILLISYKLGWIAPHDLGSQ
jgi:FtsH-binding integral membrane protein